MMSAAAMGAAAFQKGLGGIHALSHPVGALYNTHHGMTNAVFMPYVLAFNAKAIDERMVRLAMWLKLERHSAIGVIDWILRLREEVGVPHTLAGLNVDEPGSTTSQRLRKSIRRRAAIRSSSIGERPDRSSWRRLTAS